MDLFNKEGLRRVPVTEDEFNTLIDQLIANFDLRTPREHVIGTVANRIMHLPPEQAYVADEYLAKCVIKNAGWQLAQTMGRNCAHREQINQLVAVALEEPNNQQVRDALQKAINDGSPYAKEQCETRIPGWTPSQLKEVPALADVQPIRTDERA